MSDEEDLELAYDKQQVENLVGGLCIGVAANDWYCALYAGVLTASALEYKDKEHGGKWDWTDFGCTMPGVVVGHCIRMAL